MKVTSSGMPDDDDPSRETAAPMTLVEPPHESPSIYECAYALTNNEYSVYCLFDFDRKIVRNFVTNDTGVLVGTFTGDFNSGLNIWYDYDEGFGDTFKYKTANNDSIAVLIDDMGFEIEFLKANVAEAEAIINQPGYHDMN